MVRYLDTSNISGNISTIIKKAKEEIYIVSPYLKISGVFKDYVKSKLAKTNVTVNVVYGKVELEENQKKEILSIEGLNIYFYKNLHAKCYLNEESAVITSMNLHSYSQENNVEMGILINKKEDREAFENLLDDVKNTIILNSKLIKSSKNIKVENNDIIKKEKEEDTENKRESPNLKSKFIYSYLKSWRFEESKKRKVPAYQIFSNETLEDLSSKNIKEREDLKNIKGISDKRYNTFGKDLFNQIKYLERYEIVKILDIKIQYDEFEGYDQIKVEFEDGKIAWLDTTQHVPEKGSTVAVNINGKWFNEYFHLE